MGACLVANSTRHGSAYSEKQKQGLTWNTHVKNADVQRYNEEDLRLRLVRPNQDISVAYGQIEHANGCKVEE